MTTQLGDFHQPVKLYDKNDFSTNYEKAISSVKDGLTVKDSCILTFGITERTYRNWEKWAIDDIEAGFDETESNLIKLMIGLSKEDIRLHQKLSKKAIDIAINDGDSKMIQFLLKTRYGYTDKRQSDLEINKGDDTITFHFVDMKPIEEENNENNY